MTEQLMIPFEAKHSKCPQVGYLQNTLYEQNSKLEPLLNEYSNCGEHVAYWKLLLNWAMPCPLGKTNAPPKHDSARNISYVKIMWNFTINHQMYLSINYCGILPLTIH